MHQNQHPPAPTLLLILDGWGYRECPDYNAIAMANTPYWHQAWQNYPHTLISGSGLDVGLPEGQMGNSEVGHMTIGSGRIIYQDLAKINLAVTDETFFTNQVLIEALGNQSNQNAVHILGLLSAGGVHSHECHIHALIKLAAHLHVPKLYIHAFLDGRDTPPKSAAANIQAVENLCRELQTGMIASLCGRYYAMDRDKKYDRTQAAYDLLTLGKADFIAMSASAALELAYARGETDEFVKPTRINDSTTINDGDVVIYVNFRADRTKQLSYSFTRQDFAGFSRTKFPKLKEFVSFTEYANDIPAKIAFPKAKPCNVLGEYLAKHNLSQLRIAETEKYAHVTFFLDGGEEIIYSKEERKLIPSPKVATYDLAPAMSAREITKELISAIKSKQYDVIVCNLANADMLGHTGNLPATIQTIEILDECLAAIMHAILDVNGEAIITADHGNAEIMYDPETKQPHTAHTNSLLPFIYIGKRKIAMQNAGGALADVAPSLLTLLGIPVPQEMTGKSLLQIHNIKKELI